MYLGALPLAEQGTILLPQTPHKFQHNVEFKKFREYSRYSKKFAENKALNIWILRKKALPLHRFLKFRVMGN